MAGRRLLLLWLCLLCQRAHASPFSNAAEARAKMEEIVSSYALKLESQYADMTADEATGCSGEKQPSKCP